jgi:hypothetical protein
VIDSKEEAALCETGFGLEVIAEVEEGLTLYPGDTLLYSGYSNCYYIKDYEKSSRYYAIADSLAIN